MILQEGLRQDLPLSEDSDRMLQLLELLKNIEEAVFNVGAWTQLPGIQLVLYLLKKWCCIGGTKQEDRTHQKNEEQDWDICFF